MKYFSRLRRTQEKSEERKRDLIGLVHEVLDWEKKIVHDTAFISCECFDIDLDLEMDWKRQEIVWQSGMFGKWAGQTEIDENGLEMENKDLEVKIEK